MFKSVLTSTPLFCGTANSYFENRIYGDAIERDVSFISTLRALLDPRMGKDETLYLNYQRSSYDEATLSDISASRAISAIFSNYQDIGRVITIHNFEGTERGNAAWMEVVEKSFENVYPDWHRVEKVTTFFRKVFNVTCFINPTIQSVCVFVDSLTVRKMHYLQCGIFSFFPWYFDQKEGVSELEMDLIRSLREKTSEKYEECIAKIAERYDFRSSRIRQLLDGFETRYERIQCERVANNIARIINDINRIEETLSRSLKDKLDAEIMLLGLETKIAQSNGESEIMNYFLRNKNISLEYVSDTTMRFVVSGYLSYFDEDMAKRMIENASSYVYRPGRTGGNISAEDMKMLMTAIFVDCSLKMRMCAAYEFNLEGSVRPLSGYDYGSAFGNFTPNTHIDRYSCLGSYTEAINRCLKDRNYIGAVEQCMASCKSLSFADSTVMCEFMRRMYGTSEYTVNLRCIELPDGRVVKPKEAVEYLKEVAENG